MVEPWNECRQGGNMNKIVMAYNMRDFKRIMDTHQIKFFLIFGTLLGATRDGDYIDWDSDVDTGCYYEDYEKIKALDQKFRDVGFNVPAKEVIPPMDGYYIRDSEKIEIWFFKKGDTHYEYDNKIRYEHKFLDKLDTIQFSGDEYYTPSFREEFLDVTYGDWKTPKRREQGGHYIL